MVDIVNQCSEVEQKESGYSVNFGPSVECEKALPERFTRFLLRLIRLLLLNFLPYSSCYLFLVFRFQINFCDFLLCCLPVAVAGHGLVRIADFVVNRVDSRRLRYVGVNKGSSNYVPRKKKFHLQHTHHHILILPNMLLD